MNSGQPLFNRSQMFSDQLSGPCRDLIAQSTISKYDIVYWYGSATSQEFITCAPAKADAAATTFSKLGVAMHAASAGEKVQVTDWLLRFDQDTSAYTAAKQPVYLSSATAGAVSASAGTIPYVVGECMAVSATVGVLYLAPGDSSLGLGFLTGTRNVSWTINNDADATTAENPSLIMKGGSGAVLYTSTLQQDSTIPDVSLSVYNNTGAAQVSPVLNIGRRGETTSNLGSSVVLQGAAGTINRTFTVALSGTGNAVTMNGGALTNPAAASSSVSMATGATTASTGANQSSGSMTFLTGATTQSGAFANAASGNWEGGSGITDSANAGATGAASGNVTLHSGNATSTTGTTSGASGDVSVYTGTSADVATGAVNIYTGAPGTAGQNSGLIGIRTGNCTGSGLSGNASLATGTVGVAGTSGNASVGSGAGVDGSSGGALLQTGTSASLTGARTSGNVTIGSGNVTGTLAIGCGASGQVTITSGNSSQAGTVAGIGGTTGNMVFSSGNATSGLTGASAGGTGAVSIQSGNVTGTVAGALAPTASGNVTVGTGNTATNNQTAASSGQMDLHTGTVANNAAAVGNASGQILMYTGNVTNADAGGTCGASGAVNIATGTTNAGPGTGGNTGAMDLHTGNVTGATTSGTIALYTGNTTGAGTSGNITLTTGTTAGGTRGDVTVTCDQVNLRPVTDVNLLNDIPILLGTTDQWRLEYDTGAGAPFRCLLEGTDQAGTPSTATSDLLIETGTVSSVNGAAVASGYITLRTGTATCTGTAAPGSRSGIMVIGSGDVTQTTAVGTGGTSGACQYLSGASDVTFAGATGGATGTMTIGSGSSNCSAAVIATPGATGHVYVCSGEAQYDGAAAGTGANSGNVSLYSGAATSDGAGATSGSSGTANVYSGASADANTGIVNIYSGDAAGAGGGITSGNVAIRSGTVGGTGTTGNVTLASGAAAGAGTSGNITFTIGATAAGTAGTIQSIGRHTTTDGVAAGTARVIGGQAYSNPAASAAVANALTVFSTGSYTIPANTIKVGTSIRFRALVGITAVSGGGCTAQVEVFLNGTGGTLVFDTTALAAGAGCVANGLFCIEGYLHCRSVGAPGSMTGHMHYTVGAVNAVLTTGHDVAGSAAGTYTVAVTNGNANTLDIAAVTDAAGTTVVLQDYEVEIIG